MIEEFSSPSLNNLKDAIEDALTVESPQDILDCIMLTLKRNSQYHRICARHSKEVLDLLYGVDKKNNVVEINAGALDDDYLTDPKNGLITQNYLIVVRYKLAILKLIQRTQVCLLKMSWSQRVINLQIQDGLKHNGII